MRKIIAIFLGMFITFLANSSAYAKTEYIAQTAQAQQEYTQWWSSLTKKEKSIIQGIDALENEHQIKFGGEPIPLTDENIRETGAKLGLDTDNVKVYNLILIRMNQHSLLYSKNEFIEDPVIFIEDDSPEIIEKK